MEPKKHKSIQYAADAMAKLEKAIRTVRLSDQNTRDSSFNNLPDNIKQNIFDKVQSTPGWAHLIFKKGQLVGFEGGSREIYVNKEWYQSPILRRGLSRSDLFNQLKSALNLKGNVDTDNGNHQPPHIGILLHRRWRWRSFTDKPMKLGRGTVSLLGGYRRLVSEPLKRAAPLAGLSSTSKNTSRTTFPPVRLSTDWVFFDGRVIMSFQDPAGSLPDAMAEVRTAVFRMEELFHSIKSEVDGEEGADFVLAKGSQVENLVILVREFRKEVLPESMGVIKAYQVENVDEDIDEIDEACTYGAEYSHSERYMMGHITKAWSKTIVRRRCRQHAWLESPEGRQWLSYPFHNESNTISKWLATREGHKWLGSKGSEFLASESGWWWLASDLGYPWLESRQGVEWLNAEGMWFLSSPQALLWANTGISGGKVQKAWFETSAGTTWASKNCPQAVPPNPPQKPTGKMPRGSFVDQSFNNINFRGWRFVICKDIS